MIETVWQFLGNFDDRDAYRILVLLMLLFGAPIVIGIWAKVVVWATRQVRACQRVLQGEASAGEPVG